MKNDKKNESKSGKTDDIPALVVRRTRLPETIEEYCIYPKGTGRACAICYIRQLKYDEVSVDIRSTEDEKWYFYSLSEEQKKTFFTSLTRQLNLDGFKVQFNVGHMSYFNRP
ncbi:MAG: hypothetical protein PHR77_12160 [Kiritimatiellae bacterium]|nr:hypothetical protein [Kiritimatiellia bacterium]MDD5519502.1 hypothetical protein [Kiritimatiellia bacterium]